MTFWFLCLICARCFLTGNYKKKNSSYMQICVVLYVSEHYILLSRNEKMKESLKPIFITCLGLLFALGQHPRQVVYTYIQLCCCNIPATYIQDTFYLYIHNIYRYSHKPNVKNEACFTPQYETCVFRFSHSFYPFWVTDENHVKTENVFYVYGGDKEIHFQQAL